MVSIERRLAEGEFDKLRKIIDAYVARLNVSENQNVVYLWLQLLPINEKERIAEKFPEFSKIEDQKKLDIFFIELQFKCFYEKLYQFLIFNLVQQELEERAKAESDLAKMHASFLSYTMGLSQFYSDAEKASLLKMLLMVEEKIKKLQAELAILKTVLKALQDRNYYLMSNILKNKQDLSSLVNDMFKVSDHHNKKVEMEPLGLNFTAGELMGLQPGFDPNKVIFSVRDIAENVSSTLSDLVMSGDFDARMLSQYVREEIEKNCRLQLETHFNFLSVERRNEVVNEVMTSDKFVTAVNDIENFLQFNNEVINNQINDLLHEISRDEAERVLIETKIGGLEEHISYIDKEYNRACQNSDRLNAHVAGINLPSAPEGVPEGVRYGEAMGRHSMMFAERAGNRLRKVDLREDRKHELPSPPGGKKP